MQTTDGVEPDEELIERLDALHLVDTATGEPVLTVAGVLCLMEAPQDHLGKSYIEIFRYRGDLSDYDKRDLIAGPVNRQVELATDAVSEELGSELVVLGTQRHQLPRLPRVVLREAIANAVAHRQYESTGTGVRIEIRPDMVTVTSPGTLPEPVTVENMREAEAARNQSVIRVLRQLGLAEDAGRGVDVMQDEMRAELLDPPAFVETDHAVVVRLPTTATIAAEERAWIREIERRGDLQTEDRLLLVHASRGQTLTNSHARDLLNCDSTEARRALIRLTDAGFLERSGRRGGTEYRLMPDLAPPAGLRLSTGEMADVVVAAAREVGQVTNTTVRERLGVDRSTALSLLSDLVESGRLVRKGRKRGTRYVVPGET